MLRSILALTFVLSFLVSSQMRAEVPLPDFTVYGTLCVDGQYLSSGQLGGVVVGKPGVRIFGEFRGHEGTAYYVLRISLETSIGAPPSAGTAAKEGDALGAITLDTKILDIQDIPIDRRTLKAATIVRLDIGTGCPPIGSFQRGDVDGNGSLEITDPIALLDYLFLGAADLRCNDAADADDNGFLEVTDVINILSYLFLGGADLPAPGPEACGGDPTPDNLGCKVYSCPGGRAALAKRKGGSPAAPPPQKGGKDGAPGNHFAMQKVHAGLTLRSNTVLQKALGGTNPQPGQYGVWSNLLAISPEVVHIGDVSAREIVRTITIVSSSDLPLDLTLKSLAPTFAIYPGSIRLPPRASYVAFIHSKPQGGVGNRGDGLLTLVPLRQGIEVASGETLLARLRIESRFAQESTRIEVGSVRVLEGHAETIAVPVLAEKVEGARLHLGFAYDPRRFERTSSFIPGAAMQREEERSDDGLLRVTLVGGNSGDGDYVLGYLVLWPREPLPLSTFPIEIQDARAEIGGGKETIAAVVHGEVCSQKAWLDLDGDGFALSGYESVLGRRSILPGMPLFPEGWNHLTGQDPELIRTFLGERASFLDVDGSGALTEGDFQAITLALSGFESLSPDLAARAQNLSIPKAVAAIELNRLRIPRPLQGTGLEAGERISIPIVLDLVDPIPNLEFVVKSDPELLKVADFKASDRLAGAVEVLKPSTGELHIRTLGTNGEAIQAGLDSIGLLECAASFNNGSPVISVELNSLVPSVSGSVAHFVVTNSQAPGLELCATRDGSLELGIHFDAETSAVNLINLLLRHPVGTLSLVNPQVANGAAQKIETHLQASQIPGQSSLLVYHPLGEALEGEPLTLNLVYEGGPLGDSEPLGFAVAVMEARLGPETKHIRGSGLSVQANSIDSCDSSDGKCQEEMTNVGMRQIMALLEYLFQGAPAPACLGVYDRNGDGSVNLSDIVNMLNSIQKGP